ncbi:glycosyl transferase [Agaricicola taiwanensis]|uniref:Glycosyl transferase n=2 Tax=Agaricicola taiwanensis TaxID=591372 RepID=A0A8J2VNC5_9RHOB|nr:glycosyl transferase [Agaricicola taiwanensis]
MIELSGYHLPLLVILVGSLVAATIGTGVALTWLRSTALFDVPNDRSSHRTPTLRGGGIGFVPVIVIGWLLVPAFAPVGPSLLVICAVAAMAVLGFLDDRKSLKRRIRLGVQIAATGALILSVPDEAFVFRGGFPFLLDRLIAWISLVWFVNLFNFMDGIDGIAATEAAMVSGGLAALTLVAPHSGIPAREAVVVAGAALGFLVFNRPPAKLFMGDVGSLALGLALGYLLLTTAVIGYLAPAVILPMYFLADASLTLFSRLFRRAKIGDAHREHAYQRAVDGGTSHLSVVLQVAVGNLGLAGCAFYSLYHPWSAFVLAAAISLGLIMLLRAQGPAKAELEADAKFPRER